MKAFERIFLYTVLAVLIFYVFLVDGNVESQVAIQEEIRARSIIIVNDEGQEVIKLLTNDENNGGVIIYNKDGTPVVKMIASESGGMMGVSNKDSTPVIGMFAGENGGMIAVSNKDGNPVALMGTSESGGEISVKSNKGGKAVAFMMVYKDDGVIAVFNKNSEVIGHLP